MIHCVGQQRQHLPRENGKKNELKENSTNHGSGSGNVSPKRKPCQKAGKNPTKRGAHLHLPQGARGRGGQRKAEECKKGG